MPLELQPPKEGRTPYYYVRGTYLGVSVYRSTKTTSRAVAKKRLAAWKEEIERGCYANPDDPIFSRAAMNYVEAGGEARFVEPLISHFKDLPLVKIDQRALDRAALALYPDATPATRNRQVYSPAIAILRHAGFKQEFSRPKGARGKQRTTFLTVAQFQRLYDAAVEIDTEFAAFLVFLCYTGCRLSEACNLKSDDVHLSEGWAYVRETKNGEARTVYLPPIVVAHLASHHEACGAERERAFRFRKNGRLYLLLGRAFARSGVGKPERVSFHIFRHTYGAMMQRAGADLVGTGAWKSQQAANVYKHIEITEEAKKAALLPTIRSKA
jgi:integrase